MAPPSMRRKYRRQWEREYRRRIGGGDGRSQEVTSVRGMEDLFKALNDVHARVAIRARRKALQTTATELVKAAKAATPKFDIKSQAKAVLRRALFRRDPRTIERVGVKGKRRKYRPMRYTVAVRRGKQERAGADLGTFTSGKRKGQSRGVRKHSRDAWWWAFFEKGALDRRRKDGRWTGSIRPQNVFKQAFEESGNQAIRAGEKAGFAELQKIIRRQEQKAARKKNQ